MEKEFNIKNINILLGIVLPGDEKTWPSSSVILENSKSILNEFSISEMEYFEKISFHLSELPPGERIQATQAFEARNPALFRRFLSAVSDAYYTSPEIVALVRALANAAPREVSEHFDEGLVASVVRTQAGKYRR